jgi:hypothetical protein
MRENLRVINQKHEVFKEIVKNARMYVEMVNEIKAHIIRCSPYA